MTARVTNAAVENRKMSSPNRPIVNPSKLKNARMTPKINPVIQTNPKTAAVVEAAE